MLQLLPRHIFEHQVETRSWQGPQPRKLSYWSQLVAMLYAQLSGKKSLARVFSEAYCKLLHFLLAADAGTPQELYVTSGRIHELEVARKLNFAPGDLLLLDRGYVDFAWLYSLHQQGVGFVTRLHRQNRRP
jgi:hypothetical protein